MKHQLIPAILISIAVSASAAPVKSAQNDAGSASSELALPTDLDQSLQRAQENWYLQRFAAIDSISRARRAVTATEEVYIDRLQKLPNVIEMPYNSLVRKSIENFAGRNASGVSRMLGLGIYYMPIFEEALERYGLPTELKYLPVVESALNATAVSRAGAAGLWQFMPKTAGDYNLEINSLIDERLDPIAASDAAARYLKYLYSMFNDWHLALAAYNCGQGTITNAIKRAGGGKKDFWQIYPFLPNETRKYVPTFIAADYIMNYYGDHGISPALSKRPLVTDTVHVTRRVHLEQISEVLGIPMDEIKFLNPQYRSGIIPGNIKPYVLVLPSVQAYCYVANEDSIVNHNAERYAMRAVVEPSTGASVPDGKGGEYVEELKVVYHTVARGETLKSIARRYGVTAESIKRANGIRNNKVKRGTKLKINTYKRTYVPAPAAPATNTAPNDSIRTDSTTLTIDPTINDKVSQTLQKPQEVVNKPQQQSKPKQEAKPTVTTYQVKSGDTLSKIARENGTTIEAIRAANNLKNDNIQIGQKIKIPAKGSSAKAASAKSSAKSSAKKSSTKRKSSRSRRK